MSIRTKSYDAYLETYGYAYGDMSDPVKRAETVAILRRRDARNLASACREIRAQISEYSDALLKTERGKYNILINDAKVSHWRYQSCPNMRAVDLHQLRMLNNECRKRGIEA